MDVSQFDAAVERVPWNVVPGDRFVQPPQAAVDQRSSGQRSTAVAFAGLGKYERAGQVKGTGGGGFIWYRPALSRLQM
jgi:hypothetical protein